MYVDQKKSGPVIEAVLGIIGLFILGGLLIFYIEGAPPETKPQNTVIETQVKEAPVMKPIVRTQDIHFITKDGVECIMYQSSYRTGGLSCNWEKFNKSKKGE